MDGEEERGEAGGCEAAGDAADGDDARRQDGGAQEAPGAAGSGGEGVEALLSRKDARIAELESQVAEAARSAEAAESLGAQIAELKRQLADERVEFSLRAAGARSVVAARALLDEHDGEVAALKEAEPWLFSAGSGAPAGATGLEPEGASEGDRKSELRRWERLAGLAGDEDDGKREW